MTVRALALAAAALLASSTVASPAARAVTQAPMAAVALEPARPVDRTAFQADAATSRAAAPPASAPASTQPAAGSGAPRSMGAWLVWLQDHLLTHGFLV